MRRAAGTIITASINMPESPNTVLQVCSSTLITSCSHAAARLSNPKADATTRQRPLGFIHYSGSRVKDGTLRKTLNNEKVSYRRSEEGLQG